MTAPLRPTTPVAIVGAGPVGLALALGLARHGVDSVVLERNPTTSAHSKAAGIHVRTRDALRRWGIEDRFLAAGHLVTDLVLHDAGRQDHALFHLDFRRLEDEVHRPGLLVLEQSETERLLLEAVRETARCEVVFGAEVTDLEPHEDGVRVRFRREGEGPPDGLMDAEYVVGCDGASSTVRDVIGAGFEGRTYRLRPMLADVAVHDARDDLPWPRLVDRRAGPGGLTAGLRLRRGLWRIIHLTTRTDGPDDVPDEEVQRRVDAVLGEGPVDVVWSSRFRIHRRSSPRFRHGRILLAGDAAHVHSPVGGQGMNAGIQDASSLAWQLAGAVGGDDADRLLDAYDAERRAVVGGVSRFTDALTRVYLQAPRWLRRTVFTVQRSALRIPAVHRRALRRMAMLDLRLPASPLVDRADRAAGTRLPDPLLIAPDGCERRLHQLLPVGPALVRVGGETDDPPNGGDEADVEAVIRIGPGGHHDPSGLLRGLTGGDDGWVLVRPDGCVAWARSDC
ncbi:FAD-dependent oxidoreductase [Nitriliruptor alkaliphilus]|uniref:FAD-dependent oxidoreductase n=1 Tax=Nitriliruptor alkaliphilus TaxID=427918 RepID=UPI000696A0EC|nr:FAD-dependent oxidoreductase [Nitriliruptor alkaliphilus]